MLILSKEEVQELLNPYELLSALEDGFKALSSNQLNVPPRNQVTAPKGFLLGMPAYMPDRLMSVKLVSVFHADVVCLCTSSPEPVINSDWLKEGIHISSVGYSPPGGELPRDVIEASHLFVESKNAFLPPPVGSAELQGLDPEFGTELGEVLLKKKPGRKSEKETTVYKSMGHAMEDLVAANLVYQKAVEKKMGKMIEL